MNYAATWKAQTLALIGAVLTLAFLIACGAAAPAGEDSEQAAAAATAPGTEPTPTPVAEATPTSAPPPSAQPEGTLEVGLAETGAFLVHPVETINPQLFVQSQAPLGEGLLRVKGDKREFQGMLAESWEISADFLTWTFNLRQGVQFHKGYGEMTAEDVVWSMRGFGESAHPRAGMLGEAFAEREGTHTPDPYTAVVNTGEPIVPDILQWYLATTGSVSYIVSKAQSDEVGIEEASRDIAATGPWEIAEHRTAEFWRMEAVEDHWRQTPHFAELVFWEIPEESSRIAGFQTGQLDTFQMSMDSIPLVEEVEGARFQSIPGAIEMGLRIYGNWYPMEGVEPRAGYDPDLPWISGTPDFNSPEWEQARKVRLALATAIDREALVDTILGGFGTTETPLRMYTGFEHLLEGRNWEFSPERARELLEEAGYPDGFRITLTPSLRGAPAEVEGCEAIATMWGNIGLDVEFQRVPYSTLRPTLVARTYQGATCHAGSPVPTPSAGYGSYMSFNPFNRGVEHPWMEAKMNEAQQEVDTDKRRALEREIGQWLFDNVMTDVNYYTIDAVWPVGPRIEEWAEDARRRDIRNINGYEYIRHRK